MARVLWIVCLHAACAGPLPPEASPQRPAPSAARASFSELWPMPGVVLPGTPPQVVGVTSSFGVRGPLMRVTWSPAGPVLDLPPFGAVAPWWYGLDDVDRDGDADLLVSGADGARAYDVATWAEVLRLDVPREGALATVQADGDPERELAYVGAEVVIVDLDGTLVTRWGGPWGFGSAVLAELDGDGEREVLVPGPRAYAADLVTGAPVGPTWPFEARDAVAGDVDGDGLDELHVVRSGLSMVTDRDGTSRYAWDGAREYGGTRVFRSVGGRRSTLREVGGAVLRFDAATGEPYDGVAPEPTGLYSGTALPWDLDADGVDEAVVWARTALGVYREASATWERYALTASEAGVGADVDGDGVQELVLLAGDTLVVRDGETGAVRHRSPLASPVRADKLFAGDVDGDGRDEVGVLAPAGGAEFGRPEPGGFVGVWVAPGVSSGAWLRDVDGDAVSEVFGQVGAELCRWDDRAPGPTWCVGQTGTLRQVEVADLDGRGELEVVTLDARVVVRRASDGQTWASYSQPDDALVRERGRAVVATRVGSALRFQELTVRGGALVRRTLRDVGGTEATQVTTAGGRLFLKAEQSVVALDLDTGDGSAWAVGRTSPRTLAPIPVGDGVWVNEGEGLWTRLAP